jgi:hypothetical protein
LAGHGRFAVRCLMVREMVLMLEAHWVARDARVNLPVGGCQ